jgi:hypothetical protein
MNARPFSRLATRREMLRATSVFAGGTLLSEFVPWSASAGTAAARERASPKKAGRGRTVQAARQPLPFSVSGGNIVVLIGPDGKLMVATLVSTAWTKLKQTWMASATLP